MQVEIFSDVVCPWCYIGKRRFEQALADFPHRAEVEVTWRSYELDPTAPVGGGGPVIDSLAEKYGVSPEQVRASQANITEVAASLGLDYHLEDSVRGSTLQAHELLHLAHDRGLQDALKERLLRAYFTEGESPFDAETLVRLAAEAGLDPDEAATVLADRTYAPAVADDLELARAFGIRGVPFFVIDRAFGVEGAQPAELIREALDQAWAASHPLTMVASEAADAACVDGACAV
jgi:predicted DsbA family dithiol-disulfide isomerase